MEGQENKKIQQITEKLLEEFAELNLEVVQRMRACQCDDPKLLCEIRGTPRRLLS